MPKRVLAIGVGGSGKAVLTILKERLEETYGQVPDNVVLLSLDTDDLRSTDVFAGTQLNVQIDERGRDPEFRHIVSHPGTTMDTIFADIASGRSTSYMHWLEKEKLARILSPAEKSIRGGAQQRRPIGRVGLFQRWDHPIYSSVTNAIAQIYGEPEEDSALDVVKIEQSKRQIFIIGSVAGGTGSGFMIDVANLVGHAVRSNQKWQSIDVSAIIVLPDAFSSYTTAMNDPTNLRPNSYAALRELDRFVCTHSSMLPYMVRYDNDLRSITWSTNQLIDHIYLVDTACPSAVGDMDLSGDPTRGVFPIISDFVMAHIDQSLGDALATLRSNAGIHYDKEEGWQYSSFNVLTYILPIDDIIESFSYRYLQELLRRQYLPISDKKVQAQVEMAAGKEVERVFSEGSINGCVNPGVIQKAIAATKRMDPERPDMSWSGLFNIIALSENAFTDDYQTLHRWLNYLSSSLVATKTGDYRHETYDEGYTRLIAFSNKYLDDCLGLQHDSDNEEAREGGQWDVILGRYRDALCERFAEALDAEILGILNRRNPRNKMLDPAQLPLACAVVALLKDKLVSFKSLLEEEFRQIQLRQASEELRNAIAWMQDTKDTKTRALFGQPEARKAQDSYILWFQEKMSLLLHQRVYRVVLDVLDALGASEMDQSGKLSVVDQAARELETWQSTIQETSRILEDWARVHENNRQEKKQVKVRRYVTSPEFEDELYQRLEHVEAIGQSALGEVYGMKGLVWERLDDVEPLRYKMVSMWAEEAKGPEDIARRFFDGVKNMFQAVREHTSIAERLAVSFSSYASFVNVAMQVNEPFLRYNLSLNGTRLFHERYISFNMTKATTNDAREFLDQARSIMRDQGLYVDQTAESAVACTVVEVARGVKLQAVDQFLACENDYRGKLYRGRESLHLFPEEQVATEYEQLIETLNEPNNRLRQMSSELVVAMGDEAKLRTFVLACAYGLIEQGNYRDEDGNEITEVYLDLRAHGNSKLRLSQTEQLRNMDREFDRVGSSGEMARRYLNALQNFVLKVTQKPGIPASRVSVLIDDLERYGASLRHIEDPFGLELRMVNEAIHKVAGAFGPTEDEEPDQTARQALNAKRRIEKLRAFIKDRVLEFEGDKRTPPRLRDMGTVMHLVLNKEIGRLTEIAKNTPPQVAARSIKVNYRLALHPSLKNATVGQRVNVQVQLVAVPAGKDTFKIPANRNEIHCFIRADGLQVRGSEVAVIVLDPQSTEIPSASFELEAHLCGPRTYTIELFIEDPQSGTRPLVKTSGQITVSPPTIYEGPSPTLTPLEIQVAVHPDFTLRVITEFPDGKDSSRSVSYYLASRLPGLGRGEKLVGRIALSASNIAQMRTLLNQTLRAGSSAQPQDVSMRMLSLGIHFFQRLFPTGETALFHEALRKAAGRLHTWLIVEDGVTWLPWELLAHDWCGTGQVQFLAEQFRISRWIAGLGPKPYSEVPLGEIALAHYRPQEADQETKDERVEGWQHLLAAHNAFGILQVVKPETPVYGLHLLRYLDPSAEGCSIVARAHTGEAVEGVLENELHRAKLDIHLKRPVVTLGMLTETDQASQLPFEEWLLPERALPFVRAGASAVAGPWWPTSEIADRIFWPAFYDLLMRRVPLGEAVWQARMSVKAVLSQNPDWLAYTLFGDPLAEAYWPETSEGYTVLECLSQDDPLIVGKPYRFRASIRSRPPVWYQDRLVDVDSLPEDPRVLFLAPGILDEIPDPVKMEPIGRTMVQATIELTPQEEGQMTLIARLFNGDERLQVLRLQSKVGRQ